MSPEWDQAYIDRRIDGNGVGHLYDLLHTFTPGHQARVLELGFGLGGNISYWLNRSANYYGIEGSKTAVASTVRERPYLADRLACGDFTQALPFGGEFDVIFDRASISHNPRAGIASTLKLVHAALKPGGIFVGVDWFSINHSEYQRGEYAGDLLTRTAYADGQFDGVGRVHFASHEEIDTLFVDFQGVFLSERQMRRVAPNGKFVTKVNPFRWQSRAFDQTDYVSALWDIVARKIA